VVIVANPRVVDVRRVRRGLVMDLDGGESAAGGFENDLEQRHL
jgi:hypothetical protein